MHNFANRLASFAAAACAYITYDHPSALMVAITAFLTINALQIDK